MKTWVESAKPLASKDYAHINFRGAEKISNILSENIFNEFKLFEYNQLKDKEKELLLETISALNKKINNNLLTFSSQYKQTHLDKAYPSRMDTIKITEHSDKENIRDTAFIDEKSDSITDTYEFRVQIAASKTEIDINAYNYLLKKAPQKTLRKIKHNDGYMRLYITPFFSFNEAQLVADTLTTEGQDAFVVGFINNDRADIDKVKNKLKELTAHNTENPIYETEKNVVDKKNTGEVPMQFINLKEYPKKHKVVDFRDIYNLHLYENDTLKHYVSGWRTDSVKTKENKATDELPVFRVQFCASVVDLEIEFYQNIIDYFGDSMIIISKDNDGMIRYMLGDYESYDDALNALNIVFELKQDGFVIAYYKNKRIKTERAISIINNQLKK